MNQRSVRASFDEESIVVYQAFNPQIGNAAVAQQSFINTSFKQERMTWIKPSFLWMMYRSGWGRKADQEVVLGVRMKRSGFEWALRNAAIASFDRHVYADEQHWKDRLQHAPVRVQWDPEKSIHLQPLPYRSIQIGIAGIAVSHYINDWIISIENLSPLATEIHQLLRSGNDAAAQALLPIETQYPLPSEIAAIIGAR
jgi:hypothetical protein